VIKEGERTEFPLEFPSEEYVLSAAVRLSAEREVLVDDLDPHLARIDRSVEMKPNCRRSGSRRGSPEKLPAMIFTSVDFPAPVCRPSGPTTSPGKNLHVDVMQRPGSRPKSLADTCQIQDRLPRRLRRHHGDPSLK